MNEGKYIFTQVTSLVPRQIFQRLVKKYNGDYRVREFNCTNQLKYMLFGQLMPCDSLRDICLCLGKHLGIAIIAQLQLARVKALYKSPYSITGNGTLVKVNQDINEPTLYGRIKLALFLNCSKRLIYHLSDSNECKNQYCEGVLDQPEANHFLDIPIYMYWIRII